MLSELHIENVAVIEKADVEFAPGLNVLTGETGAGKSIVIDAIGAIIGSRTSRELVRTGANGALVTAVFTGVAASEWLEDNGIEPDEDGNIFILRKISADGKNTCRINGCPVSVGQLRELGNALLNIHGQNDGQHILNEEYHREYLDNFGGIEGLMKDYTDKYTEYRRLNRELESLSMDEMDKERRIDSLKFQVQELENANIRPGEEAELVSRRDLIKNAVKLKDSISGAYYAMFGSDSGNGVLSLIEEAEVEMSSASKYSDELIGVADSLYALKCQAEDVAENIREFKDSLDFSPEELDDIENRIHLLKRLSRKYGSSEEEMLQYLEKCKSELENIEYSDERREKLAGELEKKKKETKLLGAKLSEKRRDAAKQLEKRIMSELYGLNMPGVRFAVEFKDKSNDDGFDATGCDDIRFIMSANAGESMGRISKIASGGELARIMLAMKNVLAENDEVGTMVFDEVDTGVSGIAAQRVGEKLSDLAEKKQVLCVTHLPQIAVMADNHFCISKSQKNGRTYTDIEMLTSEGCRREIARLTGGENITDIGLESAREQLVSAQKYKESRNSK